MILSAEHDALFKAQGGVCAICKEPPSTQAVLSLDYDHDTGEIRGLLCRYCNQALDEFDNDPERIRKAITYLQKHDA